jgi:iron(III) transport system ATP-binding protein
VIAIRGLRKEYRTRRGPVAAVAGLDLEINDGEFCVLLGSSGCGKTTTLRCIAGLEEPDAGEIELGGELVCSAARGLFLAPERRDIGMVFQSYALWPHMTVGQVVAYPLTDGRKRAPRHEVPERTRHVLELVQLGGYEDRPVTDLSGGQQQRVALARAIVNEPRVLLMDEPLSNLDARLRQDMRVEIKRLTRRLGLTTLYVTHDQVEALSLADRVCVMRDGRIVSSGTPEQIYDTPTDSYTAQFVGQMIFLPGLVTGPNTVELPFGTTCCRLPDGLQQPGTAILLGMRHEHVLPASNGQAPSCRGTVRERMFLGEAAHYEIELDGLRLWVKLPPNTRAQPGESLALRFPPEHWLVFPAGADST